MKTKPEPRHTAPAQQQYYKTAHVFFRSEQDGFARPSWRELTDGGTVGVNLPGWLYVAFSPTSFWIGVSEGG